MAQQPQGGPPEASIVFGAFGAGGLMVFVLELISKAIEMPFLFMFPLIVDRELTGWEAVKLSCSAVLRNLGGILGLMILLILLSLAGALACCAGAILMLPLHYAMITVAYRQVFPREDSLGTLAQETEPPTFPPAPTNSGSEAIQVGDGMG
jgi:uncharacterized membrane protein